MKKYLSVVLLLAACTFEQQNGNEILFSPPILSDQSWTMSYRGLGKTGAHVCVLTAGELEVTWRRQGQKTELQVALISHMEVGDSYKILVAGHYYETRNDWFSAADSDHIVKDFMSSNITYTERSTFDTENGNRKYLRTNNKLPLQGFSALANNCKSYVSEK